MRSLAFDSDNAYMGFLRSLGITVIHCQQRYTEDADDYPPRYEVLRNFMRDTAECIVPYPTDERSMMHLFSKFAFLARAVAKAQPENAMLKLWKKIHFCDDGLHMAYEGDLLDVEWVDFQVQLNEQYHESFKAVDAIYVRSLKDVQLGMHVTDTRGAKAVLQAHNAVSAALVRRGLRVPVIGVLELLHASFDECFDIAVINPRAAHHWWLVREAWRAAPVVKHWVDAANRPDHAGYHAGMEALGLA